ncbi:unnamed protein product, partial [Owenia fusiformis]
METIPSLEHKLSDPKRKLSPYSDIPSPMSEMLSRDSDLSDSSKVKVSLMAPVILSDTDDPKGSGSSGAKKRQRKRQIRYKKESNKESTTHFDGVT